MSRRPDGEPLAGLCPAVAIVGEPLASPSALRPRDLALFDCHLFTQVTLLLPYIFLMSHGGVSERDGLT